MKKEENSFPSFGRLLLMLALTTSGASIARAQQATAPPADLPAAAQSSAAADTGDQEIVVTAQRRAERLVDVPLSINALSSRELAASGVSNVLDFNLVAPGVTMQTLGPWVQPAIRGVTSTSTSPGAEQNVAVYVDGVYQPLATSTAFDLPDVSRVEILKGPQGTLFGRNATGGAIQIFTLDPSFNPTGKLAASYGRFNDTNLSAYVSAPLSDSFAASLTGSHYSTTGWEHNLLTGKRYGKIKSDLVRGKILGKLGDRTTVVLSGFYSRRFDLHSNSYSFLNGNSAGRPLGITPIADEPNEVSGDVRSPVRTTSYGATLKVNVDVDAGTVTSTSGYIHNKLFLVTDLDATPQNIAYVLLGEPVETFTQEVVFASKKFGRFSFVTGAFGYWNSSDYNHPTLQGFLGGVPAFGQAFKTDQISYAVFGNASYDLTDKLSISGGARYTYEKRKINNNFNTNPDKRNASFNSVTPTASFIFKPDRHSNLYFTYSKGFKSGQWDVGTGVPLLVKPEKLDAFEGGYKRDIGTFSVTAAAFYYKYKGIQVQQIDPRIALASLQNAAGARIYGGELSVTARVTDAFRIVAQGAYTNAKYTSFPGASITVPVLNAAGQPIGGNQGITADLSGNRPARAPKFTGNVTGSYRKSFDAGTLELSSNIYYSTRYGIDVASRVKQPSYFQVDANANWTIGQSGLTVGVYGKNLSNEYIISTNTIANFGDTLSYAEPRNYGVRVSYAF